MSKTEIKIIKVHFNMIIKIFMKISIELIYFLQKISKFSKEILYSLFLLTDDQYIHSKFKKNDFLNVKHIHI
jgi:hypothetical protein